MKQLTVLVKNRVGVAADITAAVAARGVNIEEIDIEGVEDLGVVVLKVDRYDIALRALHDHGFKVVTQDALLVRLPDRPGALAVVSRQLQDEGLDLRSMHIIRREDGFALASLVTADNARAALLLKDQLVVDPPDDGR